MKPYGQRHPHDLIERVMAEKARHRGSEQAWADYLAGLRHGDETDILVYSCEIDDGALSQIYMSPVSSDLAAAIRCLFAEHGDSFTMSKTPTGTRVEFDIDVDGVTYHGEGEHEHGWATTPTGRCARSDREPGQFDEVSECDALAVCLAILNMYGPTEAELHEQHVVA